MAVTIRYFASARAASGTDEEHVGPATLAQIVQTMTDTHGEPMRRVVPGCSFLVDGIAVTDHDTKVQDGSSLDVLPPFAGG